MKARPILMHARSIENLLAGRKTQTRRIVKNPDHFGCLTGDCDHDRQADCDAAMRSACPYGIGGDLLWVRETTTYWERPDAKETTPRANESHRPADGARYQRWMNRVTAHGMPGEDFLVYKADGAKRSLGEWKHPHPIYEHCVGRFGKTVVSIHMPRWASRLTLVLTDVRVERVKEISEANALAEGIVVPPTPAEYRDATGERVLPYTRTARLSFIDLWNDTNGAGAWERNDFVWALTFEVVRANVDEILKEAADEAREPPCEDCGGRGCEQCNGVHVP